MNALALIPKFQERLGVSRANAVWRVIGFLFLSACFVATIALVVIVFPYTAGFTEKIPLLPGDHTQVQKILAGEVLVNRAQFLQIAEGNTTFVALGTETIFYMTKVAGVSYRYDQDIQAIPLRFHWNYFVSSQQIQNEMVVREINRKINIGVTIILYILSLVVVSSLMWIPIVILGTKQEFGGVYRKVW